MSLKNRIKALRESGNWELSKGNSIFPDDDCIAHYKKACEHYNQLVALLVEFEQSDERMEDLEPNIRAATFSNLAAANLRLDNYPGCFRLCNICLLFCNDPNLLVSDVTDDESSDVCFNKNPLCAKIAGKALFRRGVCQQQLGKLSSALSSLEEAHMIFPRDIDIKEHIAQVKKMIEENASNETITDDEEDGGKYWDEILKIYPTLVQNGGRCLHENGVWSQNIESARILFPVKYLSLNSNDGIAIRDLKVLFKKKSIELLVQGTMIAKITLEYFIDKNRCKSSIKNISKIVDLSNLNTAISDEQLLVLTLWKVPSSETFEGCEWWDRPTPGDDFIDTSQCL